MTTRTAPRPPFHPCRICGRPDYLDGLCYRHYKGSADRRYYSIKDQDRHMKDMQDQAAYEAGGCGCNPEVRGGHAWECWTNPYYVDDREGEAEEL